MAMTYTINHPAVQYIIEKDPNLIPLFTKVDRVQVTFFNDDFEFLMFTIIGQQISAKVVDIIFARLKALVLEVTPKNVIDTSFDALRSIGLSKQKIIYMKNIANYFHTSYEYFITLSKNEKVQELLNIKGVGPWTTDMYVMFVLKEENHFSIGDLGLREALKSVYAKPLETYHDILKATEKWSPYKSIVAHFLWYYWDTHHKGNIIV